MWKGLVDEIRWLCASWEVLGTGLLFFLINLRRKGAGVDGRTLKLFLTLKKEALGPQIMGVQWMTRGTQARSRVTAGMPSRASLLPLQDAPDEGRRWPQLCPLTCLLGCG